MGSRRTLKLLQAGARAPDFRLPLLSGDRAGGETSLHDLIADGPVLLAFFKVTCPVCQLTFPFLERLHQAGALPIYGISQNDAAGHARVQPGFRRHVPHPARYRGRRFPGQQRLRHLQRAHHVPGGAGRRHFARDRRLATRRKSSGWARRRASARSARATTCRNGKLVEARAIRLPGGSPALITIE